MGKSNRIKTQKAADAMSLGLKGSKRKKNGMPLWAVNLIAITCAVLIIAGAAASIMASNGVFGRMQTAAESENFRVTKNMMTYYLKTTYDEYKSQLSSMGVTDNVSLDTPISETSPEQGTWRDYLIEQTKLEVTRMLVYCEEAKTRGIELNEEDMASIDEQIEMYELYANYNGVEVNSLLADQYGAGITEKDVREAMKLATLASKCAAEISKEIEESITEDDILGEYDGDKKAYDLADYMYYEYSVTYKEAKEAAKTAHGDNPTDAQILDKYKELIAEARAKAEALKGKTDKVAFKTVIIDDIATDVYDSSLGTAKDDIEVKDDKMPSEADRATIKTKLVEKVREMLIAGKDKLDEDLTKEEGEGESKTYKVFDITVTEDYAKLFDYFAGLYFDDMVYNLGRYTFEKATYDDKDDAIKWIFADSRLAGDIKDFESGDNKKKDDGTYEDFATNTSDLSNFKVKVYLVNKPQYKNVEKTKNIAIMHFATSNEAKAALAKLKKGMTLEEFEKLAEELSGSFMEFEDYAEGDSGVSKFDEWAFADTTEVGSVTAEVIELAQNTYGVALYYKEGHEEWYVTVRDALYSEKIDKKGEEIAEKYTVNYNDKVMAKLDIRRSN